MAPSDVWKHYTIIPGSADTEVKFKHCNDIISRGMQIADVDNLGTTSNAKH